MLVAGWSNTVELFMLKPRVPMNQLFFALIVTCFVTLPATALAEPSRTSTAASEVCDGGSLVGKAATGDLDSDNHRDMAAFFSCDSSAETLHLVVLLGTPHGRYHLLAKTLIEPHMRRWDSVKVTRGNLLVEQGCAADCNFNWKRSFKFRLDAGVLRLIGEERVNHDGLSEDSSNGLIDYDTHYGSSINYLTGTAVHWRKSKSMARHLRRTIHFPAGATASFQDFDFDRQVPGVHGYINDEFELSMWQKY